MNLRAKDYNGFTPDDLDEPSTSIPEPASFAWRFWVKWPAWRRWMLIITLAWWAAWTLGLLALTGVIR